MQRRAKAHDDPHQIHLRRRKAIDLSVPKFVWVNISQKCQTIGTLSDNVR